jgi:hypothetical protein
MTTFLVVYAILKIAFNVLKKSKLNKYNPNLTKYAKDDM